MPEYVQCFADNKIDVSVLPHLTDQDLKDIGIPLGHRRKMLVAITEMTGTAPATPAVTPATEPKPQDTAETPSSDLMFSDLVGSTALSARMDPEDLREVISVYQKCVAETVQRFGGFLAKYMGDGVLVYFGYPHAHEDDAERAVRAGLELVGAVGALKTTSATFLLGSASAIRWNHILIPFAFDFIEVLAHRELIGKTVGRSSSPVLSRCLRAFEVARAQASKQQTSLEGR
jgi:hypothetical protein